MSPTLQQDVDILALHKPLQKGKCQANIPHLHVFLFFFLLSQITYNWRPVLAGKFGLPTGIQPPFRAYSSSIDKDCPNPPYGVKAPLSRRAYWSRDSGQVREAVRIGRPLNPLYSSFLVNIYQTPFANSLATTVRATCRPLRRFILL